MRYQVPISFEQDSALPLCVCSVWIFVFLRGSRDYPEVKVRWAILRRGLRFFGRFGLETGLVSGWQEAKWPC